MEFEKGLLQQFIEWIIQTGGLYVLILVVFAETGLIIGFLFPGDSLLFAAGIYVDDLAKEFFNAHWSIILALVAAASILGNIVGYWFGLKTGPFLFERKDTWFFKKKHLIRSKIFYDKYGKSTIFLAKFLPFIRTFAPMIAGIVKMKKSTFMFYNIVGSICWVSSMMLGGYFLESLVKEKWNYSLKDHIEVITLAIIFVTTVPVLYKIIFIKKDHDQEISQSS
ncbi:MAG: DedA family protein [Chitinophagaceae bacterium]|nr:MAG: DedA family protein [Chitinophagaceae bacterium]